MNSIAQRGLQAEPSRAAKVLQISQLRVASSGLSVVLLIFLWFCLLILQANETLETEMLLPHLQEILKEEDVAEDLQVGKLSLPKPPPKKVCSFLDGAGWC